ncbi:23S ribosomal RNA methyltransferase Erm [Paenibacillus sp. J5C_2022]|uniref:23S ribosomal RNA methyltransferase Erm n=1 Tax=Paenibacillus sp. J5C2022 TaxID=2977129 RepID=UPI0021D21DDA|nr:23S ribosomal RNA methyltransferase Erm [Paenibacillus sp. J5C2022]MCU6711957.1 23S ribosomal RNA methyltransferase Erm [Paenibacillus sp. J5C2022]
MRKKNKNNRAARQPKLEPNRVGQHLLHHPRTIGQLIGTIHVKKSDTVLEIGAGKGSLTFPIADRAGKVIAVEIDAEFVKRLRIKAEDTPHIHIIHSDIRRLRLPSEPFCIIANIPFSITTAILEKLLGVEGKSFQRGALIMEKGAAIGFTQRAVLNPRLLMWRMQFRFQMKTVIPRTHFAPPPRVDAAIVCIARREHPLVPFKEGRRFSAFAAYMLREPKLAAAHALTGIFTPAQLRAVLQHAGVDRERTVASLSLEQWAALFLAMLRHVSPYRWPRG